MLSGGKYKLTEEQRKLVMTIKNDMRKFLATMPEADYLSCTCLGGSFMINNSVDMGDKYFDISCRMEERLK